MFNLSAQQMEEEPIDQFFINLYISGQIEKQKERMDKYGVRE